MNLLYDTRLSPSLPAATPHDQRRILVRRLQAGVSPRATQALWGVPVSQPLLSAMGRVRTDIQQDSLVLCSSPVIHISLTNIGHIVSNVPSSCMEGWT